ncbi:hypothetical protein B14911_21258 [Bacillus sp. NRRL B-14911]|nr:hypothetical protein B14911_21258 [Bacillus sp. NRRL B-14911]
MYKTNTVDDKAMTKSSTFAQGLKRVCGWWKQTSRQIEWTLELRLRKAASCCLLASGVSRVMGSPACRQAGVKRPQPRHLGWHRGPFVPIFQGDEWSFYVFCGISATFSAHFLSADTSKEEYI